MVRGDPVVWRLHLRSPPDRVWEMVATAEGRSAFWAESAGREGDVVHFVFPNGIAEEARILEERPGRSFHLLYFGLETRFELEGDGVGGTDLTLWCEAPPAEEREEVVAGWVSVLLALKAAVDHGVDLRNHDPARSWDRGFVDN